MPDPTPVYTGAHVKVEIDGLSDSMDTLLFKSVTPPDWSIETPKEIFHGDNQLPYYIVTGVQNPTYGHMTLTQGWDKDHVMATWRAKMESAADLKDKWKKVTITWYSSDGQTAFAGWTTDHAILINYSHSASDPGSHAPFIVTVTLAAVEQWQQTDGSAPITA